MSKESGGVRRHWSLVAGAMLVILLALPVAAEARVGGLDPSFGEGGQVVASIEGSSASPEMAIAPDGAFLIRKGSTLARFLPDGGPAGFGDGGRLRIGEEMEGLTFQPSSIAMDSAGRVLVFGFAADAGNAQMVGFHPALNSWAAVLRYGVDGKPDLAFGEGKGFVRGDFGIASDPPTELPTVKALTGTVDAQDRPLLVAGAAREIGGCTGHTTAGDVTRAIVRLTAAGQPDAAFGGGDGVAPLEGLGERPSLTSDQSGQPLVSIRALRHTGCSIGARVIRLGADGRLLPGFGESGSVLYRGWRFAALGPTGALIFFRREPSALEIFRTRPNGSRENSFGDHGTATVSLPAGARRTLRPVAVDSRGRILLAGSFVLPKPKGGGGQARGKARKPPPHRSFFVVMRLLPSGKVDPAFGRRGRIVTRVGPSGEDVVAGPAALDPQGRLVVVGSAVSPGGLRGDVFLARYLLGS